MLVTRAVEVLVVPKHIFTRGVVGKCVDKERHVNGAGDSVVPVDIHHDIEDVVNGVEILRRL